MSESYRMRRVEQESSQYNDGDIKRIVAIHDCFLDVRPVATVRHAINSAA